MLYLRTSYPRSITVEYMSPACSQPAPGASKTHYSGLGPPWRSHPCIEGYPQCHRVRAVGMERSDRQHQPIADTQSRFTVYVTGLVQLPEPPKRIFRVWGRHGGPILVLRATHSATGCVPWVWNDQTGNNNRLPIRTCMLPRPKYGTSTWYRCRGSAAVHAGGRGDRMTPVHTMKYTKIVCFEQGSQNEGFRQNCGRPPIRFYLWTP